MSDFYFEVDVLRSRMAEQLVSNSEQAVWVLAEFADAACEDELAAFSDNMDHDPKHVAAFYRRFADLIEGKE